MKETINIQSNFIVLKSAVPIVIVVLISKVIKRIKMIVDGQNLPILTLKLFL